AAQKLAIQLRDIADHGRTRATDWRTLTLALIEELVIECAVPGWNGYKAKPISTEAKRRAQLFVDTLPPDLEPPEPAPDPDGAIALCWDRGPGRLFTVSIAPSGIVSYAGLLGPEIKRHGQEPFRGEVPRIIIDSLRELYS